MAASQPVLANSSLTTERKLGSGAFGEVYLVRDDLTGRRYALKTIECTNNHHIELVEREVKSLRQLQHPNIVQMLDADGYRVRNRVTCRVLMEFCEKGNLNDRLSLESSTSTELKWMVQLASAAAYLHRKGIIHRDLKPDNVLLVGNQNKEDIKLGDFGLAREFVALMYGEENSYLQYYATTAAGCIPYMAPEVFTGKYTEKADIFSLGIIFYAIFERHYLNLSPSGKAYGWFDGQGRGLGQAMHQGSTPSLQFTRRNNQKVVNLISRMVRRQYKSRPDGSQIEKELNEVIRAESNIWPKIASVVVLILVALIFGNR